MADKLIPIVSDPNEQATVDLIDGACAEALQLIQQSSGLGAPQNCRIYVMTSAEVCLSIRAVVVAYLAGGNIALLEFSCAPNLALQRRLDSTLWKASGDRGETGPLVGAKRHALRRAHVCGREGHADQYPASRLP